MASLFIKMEVLIMSEKIYKTMGKMGGWGITSGIILIVMGLTIGVLHIIYGGKLLMDRKDITF